MRCHGLLCAKSCDRCSCCLQYAHSAACTRMLGLYSPAMRSIPICRRRPQSFARGSYTCSRVPASSGPTLGSPWLPPILNVRLDTASDPGEYQRRLLPTGGTKPSALTQPNLSGLNTFKVGSTRYLCTSPAFASTHRLVCYQPRRKARYWARGARLPRRDSHPLEHATLPGRTDPFSRPLFQWLCLR